MVFKKNLSISILLLMLVTPLLQSYANPAEIEICNDFMFPYKTMKETVKNVIEEAKKQFDITMTNYDFLKENKKLDSFITGFYGKPSSLDHDIIFYRLQLTKKLLNSLTIESFRTVEWAFHCHPNSDFRDQGIPDDREKVYAGVNYFGLQMIDEEEFIDDEHLYLGDLFFSRSSLRVSTLFHELSHLATFPLDVVLENPSNAELYNRVVTADLLLKKGEENGIKDAYLWEEFLIELFNKRVY